MVKKTLFTGDPSETLQGMSVSEPKFPVAHHDFYASNHGDHGTYNDEPSLTRQEFAEECDINVIMARYEKTGVIDHLAAREPRYLDLSDIPDFRTAMDMMQEAEIAFMSLPAKVRREFENDPRNFVDFASNPENLDQMRQWGLAPPAPQEPKVPADTTPPADKAAPEAPEPV